MPAASFKKTLIGLLDDYIQKQVPLAVSWECIYCGGRHTGNLFKKVRSVADGTTDHKDEIPLQDETGQTFAVIGISKNKKPNTEIANTYRDQRIIYLQICPPLNGNDNILETISKPKLVGTCLNPKCKTCGGFQHEKSMVIIDSACWKCGGAMKVAVLDCQGHHPGPDGFTADELGLARSKGVLIQDNYSKTVGHSYLSNTCPSCNMLTGDHFLFTDHFCEAMYGNLTYERFPLGYFCEVCHWNS